MGHVSDGYHTFDELYEHRVALFMALGKQISEDPRHQCLFVWRSRTHSDGSSYPSWFVMGIGDDPGKQITYHLPNYLWDECSFCETRDKAPEWDGHTPADVLARVKDL